MTENLMRINATEKKAQAGRIMALMEMISQLRLHKLPS